MSKLLKKVFVLKEHDFCEFEESENKHPNEFISFLRDKISEIPEEFSGSAVINLESDSAYEYGYVKLEIFYKRPETDEESSQRLAREKASMEMAEKRELCELERLRKKFNV